VFAFQGQRCRLRSRPHAVDVLATRPFAVSLALLRVSYGFMCRPSPSVQGALVPRRVLSRTVTGVR
jgi:hypothetical protein